MKVASPFLRGLNRLFPARPQGHREWFERVDDHTGVRHWLVIDRPPGPGPFLPLLYLDATLPSSAPVPAVVQDLLPGKVLLVGMGYERRLFAQRNRDYVPARSDLQQVPGPARRAGAFFRFLEEDIVPWVSANHPLIGEWGLVGHSLGGLFGVYALTRPDNPFRHICAISPSVWLVKSALLHHLKDSPTPPPGQQIYLAAGGWERFNLVLPSMQACSKALQQRNWPNLQVHQQVFPWKNHFTVVKPALQAGLRQLYGVEN